MGFETLPNIALLAFELDFEAVPMGFETADERSYRNTRPILKQSLWDLKHPVIVMDKVTRERILKQSLWDLKLCWREYTLSKQ